VRAVTGELTIEALRAHLAILNGATVMSEARPNEGHNFVTPGTLVVGDTAANHPCRYHAERHPDGDGFVCVFDAASAECQGRREFISRSAMKYPWSETRGAR
jgi:hypothetical protein